MPDICPAALYLHPKAPDRNIEISGLIKILRSIGLIEKKIPDTENSFYAGSRFLNIITFLGCSPSIQFTATADNPNYCFIRLIDSRTIKMIHTRKQARAPQCPHCNKPLEQWHELAIDSPWRCPDCKQTSSAHEFNWKHTAGIARLFIEISDIYPKEAIPQPILLERLASETGVEWGYFYYAP